MKSLLIALMGITMICQAEGPERIASKTLEIRSISWYETQANAWRQELKSNGLNSNAWYQLYAASYYAQQSEQELLAILDEMEKAVPSSYEYLVVKGWHDEFTKPAWEALNDAYKQKPNQPEALLPLQLFSEYYSDENSRKGFSHKLFQRGLVSANLLNYSYNVLMSLDPNSILITEGESATTPLYILQDVMKVRTDVSILSLDLLLHDEYRKRKLLPLGIRFEWADHVANKKALLCAQLPKQNENRKFYYALTIGKENVTSIREYLYVVGLASLHSNFNFDNIAQVKQNIEHSFLTDYLLVDFNGASNNDAGRVFNPNYLLPMILLYERYRQGNEMEKAKKLRTTIEKIADDAGQTEMISSLLDQTEQNEIPYFPFAINVKSWEGTFRPVSENVYANEYEVTNAQYNRFLNYLTVNGLNDLLQKYQFDFSEYTEPALSLMRNYAADQIPTKKNRFFTQYPAVNISFEAANAYCAWLTEQYNRSSDKKFKKVVFRLPSMDEWQIAAASIKNPTSWKLDDQVVEVKVTPPGEEFGKNFELKKVKLDDPEIKFPWFRHFNFRNTPINNKGCYLGNYKVPDHSGCPGAKKLGMIAGDAFLTMSPTGVYFPNDIGLYDVSGNVAEMINEKGKACGGSWNHTPEESTIRSINQYSKPDAAVGFRVFMEVIER